MIHCSSISKSFKGSQVLFDINLVLEKSQVIGIVGPNGTGKTTLLKILCGLLKSDSGTVQVDVPTTKISMTSENLGYPSINKIKWILKVFKELKSASTKEMDTLVARLGLSDHLNKSAPSLSQGLKQRLNIACALLGNPEIIILDEPNNGLDPDGFNELRAIIDDLKKEHKTVIIASHILSEVEKTCDHIVLMRTGKIIISESLEKLQSDYGTLENAYSQLTAAH